MTAPPLIAPAPRPRHTGDIFTKSLRKRVKIITCSNGSGEWWVTQVSKKKGGVFLISKYSFYVNRFRFCHHNVIYRDYYGSRSYSITVRRWCTCTYCMTHDYNVLCNLTPPRVSYCSSLIWSRRTWNLTFVKCNLVSRIFKKKVQKFRTVENQKRRKIFRTSPLLTLTNYFHASKNNSIMQPINMRLGIKLHKCQITLITDMN